MPGSQYSAQCRVCVAVLLLSVTTCSGQEVQENHLRQLSQKALYEMIEAHEKRLETGFQGERADFSGLDLSGLDFTKCNLRGAFFDNARLNKADFRGAILDRARFPNAGLSKADFRGASLAKTNFSDSDLSGADFSEVDLTTAILRGADLNGAYLSGANLKQLDLSNMNLSGADLENADLSAANLFGADLTGAFLYKANLNKAICQGARMNNANLGETQFREANLSSAALDNVQLMDSDLSNSNCFKASFDDAQLLSTQFCDADLSSAKIRNANLFRANLSGATMIQTEFRGSILSNADLSDGDLRHADLTGANLYQATLPKAQLANAILADTNLSNADLTECDLSNARMDGADLSSANITGVRFEPLTVPPASLIVNANGLQSVRFERTHAMQQLRRRFKDAGFRQAERQVTYMLKKAEQERPGISWYESWGLWLMFDATCEYGRKPGRPLWIMVALFVFFSIPYAASLWILGKSGIWKTWPKERIRQDLGGSSERVQIKRPERVEFNRPVSVQFYRPEKTDAGKRGSDKSAAATSVGRRRWQMLWWPIRQTASYFFQILRFIRIAGAYLLQAMWWFARVAGAYSFQAVWWSIRLTGTYLPSVLFSLLAGCYFSLLSTFHFGWKDFDVGVWIARIQRQEYVLRATGWVKTLAGIQSVLSLYLLALWALTYFGRPFE